MDYWKVMDQNYWEAAWKHAEAQHEARRRLKDKVEAWNKRAQDFEHRTGGGRGKNRLERIFSFLDTHQVFNSVGSALDLGCGPGEFTLEMARRGVSVTALDPAVNMLDILREKLEAEPPDIRGRVQIVQADWLDVDLDDLNYRQSFDLVFASMSPGVKDGRSLQKTLAASKKYVFISKFAGPRLYPSVAAILQQERGMDLQQVNHMDIIFPFNWLYAGGYKPELSFYSYSRTVSEAPEEAKREIINHIRSFVEIDDRITEKVSDYVEGHTKDGIFSEDRGATHGMLLTQV